jgi:hypothetical protein
MELYLFNQFTEFRVFFFLVETKLDIRSLFSDEKTQLTRWVAKVELIELEL